MEKGAERVDDVAQQCHDGYVQEIDGQERGRKPADYTALAERNRTAEDEYSADEENGYGRGIEELAVSVALNEGIDPDAE